jgi:hypothetical protein
MRINLVTPFSEKDAVKALGARWDGVKKVWYIVDVSDLDPFRRWIPDLEAATEALPRGKAHTQPATSQSPGIITKSATEVQACDCNVLPWEACRHSGG